MDFNFTWLAVMQFNAPLITPSLAGELFYIQLLYV